MPASRCFSPGRRADPARAVSGNHPAVTVTANPADQLLLPGCATARAVHDLWAGHEVVEFDAPAGQNRIEAVLLLLEWLRLHRGGHALSVEYPAFGPEDADLLAWEYVDACKRLGLTHRTARPEDWTVAYSPSLRLGGSGWTPHFDQQWLTLTFQRHSVNSPSQSVLHNLVIVDGDDRRAAARVNGRRGRGQVLVIGHTDVSLRGYPPEQDVWELLPIEAILAGAR